MKVVLSKEEDKFEVLHRAKNLKAIGRWSRVFVHRDLTPRQREVRHRLVSELKSRTANGESDLMIRRGMVVKGRAKVAVENPSVGTD